MTDAQILANFKPASKYQQLADALILVAKADHYMVGIVDPNQYSIDDWDGAFDILVTAQNRETEGSEDWASIDLALDLCENYRKKAE